MSGSRKNPFDDLPTDIIHNPLAEQLTPESMGILPRLSQYFYHLFKHEDPWKTNLISQLGARPQELARLEILRNDKKISFHYRELYQRYLRLLKILRSNIAGRYSQEISTSNDYQIFLLASCVNDPFFLKWVPLAMLYEFHIWSIFAGSNVIHEEFLKKCSLQKFSFLVQCAIVAENSSVLRRLLTVHNEPGQSLRPDASMLEIAIRTGDIQLARKILAFDEDNSPPYMFKLALSFISFGTITSTSSIVFRSSLFEDLAKSGNPELLNDLLALRNSKGNPLVPLPTCLNYASNIKIFNALLALKDKNGNSILSPNPDTLCHAIKARNKELVSELLTIKDELGQPKLLTYDVIAEYARLGDLEKVREFLALKDKNNKFKFIPGRAILLAATESGNLELFRELMALKDVHNNPRFTVDENIVRSSLKASNSAIFYEILAMKNAHGLPLVQLAPYMITYALENNHFELALKLLTLEDENGNFKIEAPFRLFTRLNATWSLGFLRTILSLKDKNGLQRFAPTQELLHSAARHGSASVLHEVLMLKDENGNPLLSPTTDLLTGQIPLVNLYELFSYKNANGEPVLVPLVLSNGAPVAINTLVKFNIDDNILDNFKLAINAPHRHDQILIGYKLVSDAREAISKHDLNAAMTALTKAYVCSPIVFFKEVTAILTNTQQPLEDEALKLFEAVLVKLLQIELEREKFSWAVEKLKELQIKLLAAQEANAKTAMRVSIHKK
jgi:hypothetical protein